MSLYDLLQWAKSCLLCFEGVISIFRSVTATCAIKAFYIKLYRNFVFEINTKLPLFRSICQRFIWYHEIHEEDNV